MKLLIEVQTYNRKPITEIVLNQILKHKDFADLRIINDYSTEYDNEWLKQFTDNVIQYEKKLTINNLKWRTFKNFLDSDYTHLYMCDNDAYHDPDFVKELKYLSQYNLPATLYRSSFIHSFGSGVHKYITVFPEYSLKKGLFGGISVLLNREHIEKIVNILPSEEEWLHSCKVEAWDSKIQRMISPDMYYIISNKSYVEHFGWKGANHTEINSDVALDPTDYLKTMNKEIWDYLKEEYGKIGI
jgi:hypothetical protein